MKAQLLLLEIKIILFKCISEKNHGAIKYILSMKESISSG